MPSSPKRPCPGKGPRRSKCKNLISKSERCCQECLPHDTFLKKDYDKRRGSSADRGYDHQWRKVRQQKLNEDPLCEICLKEELTTLATTVHHIEAIDTHPHLRLTMSNLQSVCNEHHEEIEKDKRWGRKSKKH
jgi:5-methylcytosine-specific restriction enzyme A